MTDHDLMREAWAVRARAYAPYSRFSVGAALLCSDGRVFRGCNIENAAYSPGLCAERAAVAAAVAAGAQVFSAIAVAGGPEGGERYDLCPPCGVCRQVLREFCRPEFRVLLAEGTEQSFKVAAYTLADLLPHSFGPERMVNPPKDRPL